MLKSLQGGVLLAGVMVGIAGCNQSPPSVAGPKLPSQASQQWDKLTAGFIESYLQAQPQLAVEAGRHEFDGQLPDVSNHGIRREIARLHDERDQIAAVDPKTLEPRERFDREYLLAVVDRDLFWLEKAKSPGNDPQWYLGKLDPDAYLSRNYAPLNVRIKSYIKYARGLPKMANDIKANLQSPMPKTYVELGIAQFGGLADFFAKEVAPVFASVNDPDLQKQLMDANTVASQSMTQLKQYLSDALKKADDKFALGPDLFSQMLTQSEGVSVPLAQIEAAGRADLERNTQALKAECDSYAPKVPLAQCVLKQAAHKPPGNVLDAARAQLVLLKDFIVKNHVAAIPGTDDALVAEAPPYNRGNFAFIQIPGPYEQNVASVYNITPPDPKWSKAEQAAYIPADGTLLFASVHEVWPGHFLQFLHSNSNPDKLEGLWVLAPFAEGWAHYCEEMMYDMGLGKGDPEKHIGELVLALQRDVRLLSAIGLHTEGMSVAQSEKMFREQAYLDPGNARQQAARGTYDPGYLRYTLGKLMIRKLRSDWLTKRGAAPDDQSKWHEFHDEFMSYGGPPIGLLRKQMLGDPGQVL